MSELINNSQRRKGILKQLILELHNGVEPEIVKEQIQKVLKQVPYGEVVEVEQELIAAGLPVEEVMKLCDIHSKVLHGSIDLSGFKKVPEGHPVDTFTKENLEISNVISQIFVIFNKINNAEELEFSQIINVIKGQFNLIADIDKHYKRKEFLLFPFLEKYGITGPPTVMWGKHDEVRELLKASLEALSDSKDIDDLKTLFPILLNPVLQQIADMIVKEESILFPMSMDRLTELEWYEIYQQTLDYGYCIFDAPVEWKPSSIVTNAFQHTTNDDAVRFPTGKLNPNEILGILNTLPFDLTFVDKDDKVKYFSEGAERIFARSRAILHRDVRLCHPPSSVHIVDQIIDDFKTGKESHAPFWINMHGKFIHIEYFAVRDEKGEYLGTLEVSQELSKLRALEGEQRLLNYGKKD
jgi:hypothetical protein